MSALRGKKHWQSVEADVRRTAERIARETAEATEEARVKRKAAMQEARAEIESRPSATKEALVGATEVFDARHWTWHKVVRVSAKSVSVETGYSWVDRIPLERVKAWR